jgi:hypothetical protein
MRVKNIQVEAQDSDKIVLRISGDADKTLFTATINNAGMQFRHIPSGAHVNISNYQIEIMGGGTDNFIRLENNICQFHSPSGTVVIRDGVVIAKDFIKI